MGGPLVSTVQPAELFNYDPSPTQKGASCGD